MAETPYNLRPTDVHKQTDAEIVNGDPYVAVLISDQPENDLQPEAKETVLLGTGYSSMEEIVNSLTHLINNPEQREEAGISFKPDNCHVFELVGEFELKPS